MVSKWRNLRVFPKIVSKCDIIYWHHEHQLDPAPTMDTRSGLRFLCEYNSSNQRWEVKSDNSNYSVPSVGCNTGFDTDIFEFDCK